MTHRRHVLIVEARFYEDIADELVKGATAVLDSEGFSCERQWVPGVFELPAACQFALRSRAGEGGDSGYDGVIALGCVIRGETDHYDHICREASRALMDLSVHDGVALGFGVLTCENRNQAWVRAAVDRKNKGADAARACLRMIELRRAMHSAAS